MVHYSDHHWLLNRGPTRFYATLSAASSAHWRLEVHYLAGGAVWRRVQSQHRPRLKIVISGFSTPGLTWPGLEHLSFWGDEGHQEHSSARSAGWLEVGYRGPEGRDAPDIHLSNWRVVGREGHHFKVEIVGYPDQARADDLAGADFSLKDAAHWQQAQSLYLREDVPFGTVTVQVPRNSPDPELYAVQRATHLLGTGQPEHIEINDHANAQHEAIRGSLYLHLHYHGYYED